MSTSDQTGEAGPVHFERVIDREEMDRLKSQIERRGMLALFEALEVGPREQEQWA